MPLKVWKSLAEIYGCIFTFVQSIAVDKCRPLESGLLVENCLQSGLQHLQLNTPLWDLKGEGHHTCMLAIKELLCYQYMYVQNHQGEDIYTMCVFTFCVNKWLLLGEEANWKLLRGVARSYRISMDFGNTFQRSLPPPEENKQTNIYIY